MDTEEVSSSSEVDDLSSGSESEQEVVGVVYPVGRVYRITACDRTYYIGSTSLTLEQRLVHHKGSLRVAHKAASCAKHFAELGWNVVIEQISEHRDVTKAELRHFEDLQIRQHIKNPLCLNQFRAEKNEEEYRVKAMMRERKVRKDLAARRASGEPVALAREAKAQSRKSKRVVCPICGLNINYGNAAHRATVRCIAALRKRITEGEAVVEPDQDLRDRLIIMRRELPYYEKKLAEKKEYEASRVDTCKRCGETFPHSQAGAHKLFHQREDKILGIIPVV